MAKYWFKRRRYGYGWTPVTWQGWLTVLVFLLIVIAAATAFLEDGQEEFTAETGVFFLILILSITGLLKIGYAKGPKPKWRWGKRPDDNPAEDW